MAKLTPFTQLHGYFSSVPETELYTLAVFLVICPPWDFITSKQSNQTMDVVCAPNSSHVMTTNDVTVLAVD